MKTPRPTLLSLIKGAPGKASAIKGRPRTATTHTGFLSVQRALQKKK